MRNFRLFRVNSEELLGSKLYSNETFYSAFIKDLNRAQHKVIIECPFITQRRIGELAPTLSKLWHRGVQIVVNTRDPEEHEDPYWQLEAQRGIEHLQSMGVQVLFTVNHHRKLAILDDTVLWEGSLNILSFRDSCEMMRRTHSPALCTQMLDFTGMSRWS